MSVDGDNFRRLADVVDALQETRIDVDAAHLLLGGEESVRGQLTVTIPDDADLSAIGVVDEPVREESEQADEDVDVDDDAGADDDREDDVDDEESEAAPMLDHTSTDDLQQAYDEADGNISQAAERFDVTYGTVYQRMCDHGVHGTDEDEDDDQDDSGTSTEDDTELSEAPVDLEEDAADDAPEDTGDDVQDSLVTFDELPTPDWLDEASFYSAADISDDVEDLAETLGWHEHDALDEIVDQLDVDVARGESA